MKLIHWILLTCALVSAGGTAIAATELAAVKHTKSTINGMSVTVWTWTDSNGKPRTVALKNEGGGNAGHGGYAVQMTYYGQASAGAAFQKVTLNAAASDGFGYFVSHERYRLFADGTEDTVAAKIFHASSSPLGKGFVANAIIPSTASGVGIERFTIGYGHYGSITPHPVNPNTGTEATPLPLAAADFAHYSIPVTTSWVFQNGTDYPRINVEIDLSKIIPPGGKTPTADLVSFDMRGPYGVLNYDEGLNLPIETALWGDHEYLFTTLSSPVTRQTTWDWSHPNTGAVFNAQIAGGFEIGLYQPLPASSSKLVDDYAAERGFTSGSFAAAGGVSHDFCASDDVQTMPSDATWPYQSVQYSLPCPESNQPAYLKKIAWGSSLYYGTSLTKAYNGRRSYALAAFPANHVVSYDLCLVLGYDTNGTSLTFAAASEYTAAHPVPATSKCATAPL